MFRLLNSLCAVAALLIPLAQPAAAQDYPSRGR